MSQTQTKSKPRPKTPKPWKLSNKTPWNTMKGQHGALCWFSLTAESKHRIIQTECKLTEIWEHMERGRTFLLQHRHQHLKCRAVKLLSRISFSTTSTLTKGERQNTAEMQEENEEGKKKEKGTKSFFYPIYTCEDPHGHNIVPWPLSSRKPHSNHKS